MNTSVIGFQEIYQDYSRDVYRFAYWLSGDSDVAQDIASETFIRLWTARDDISVETVKAYLFKIARNLFLQNKRNQKQTIMLDHNMVDSAAQPDHVTEVRSELRQVMRAMQELPDIERMVLVMKIYDRLSYQEISSVLGLSVSAIKVRIHRARLKLSFQIDKKENNHNDNY